MKLEGFWLGFCLLYDVCRSKLCYFYLEVIQPCPACQLEICPAILVVYLTTVFSFVLLLGQGVLTLCIRRGSGRLWIHFKSCGPQACEPLIGKESQELMELLACMNMPQWLALWQGKKYKGAQLWQKIHHSSQRGCQKVLPLPSPCCKFTNHGVVIL